MCIPGRPVNQRRAETTEAGADDKRHAYAEKKRKTIIEPGFLNDLLDQLPIMTGK
jgi:hypothetical protein